MEPNMPEIVQLLLSFFNAHKATLLLLATSAIGAGFGAWFGARAIFMHEERKRERGIQTVANTSIAALVALLGKMINFKKDLALPAAAEAETLSGILAGFAKNGAEKNKVSIRLELWPEIPFDLRLPDERLFEYASRELDVIQLLKMLEYNLAELSHFVAERNALIREMNAHQGAKGTLPAEGLRLYMKYAAEIARNAEENLFFIDRSIDKIRMAAKKILPRRLHGGIADVGLRPETQPLMPPKDLIKGWVK